MQKRFQHYMAKHNCVEKCDCCRDYHILWEIVCLLMMRLLWILVVIVAPGVCLAIFRDNHVSWVEKIMRDARMSRRAAKRHFSGRRDECG
ncbi:MAG: hypothetical protein ACETVP_05630 [Candidatus Bathyarchaeia archaeon]